MTKILGVVVPLALLVPLQTEILGTSLSLILLLAGTALIVAEALAPGANFIVIGIAMFLAGGIGFLVGGPLASPIALTGMVLLFSALSFYFYSRFDIYGGKGSGKTTDSDSLRGRTGRVTETVTATNGEVKLRNGGFNPYYSARSVDGDTIEEGTEVVVMDPGGGNVLTVQSVEGESLDEIDRELARNRRDASSDGGSRTAEREREYETE